MQWFDSHRPTGPCHGLRVRRAEEAGPEVLAGLDAVGADGTAGRDPRTPGRAPHSGASLVVSSDVHPGWISPSSRDDWVRHHGGLFQTILELRGAVLGYERTRNPSAGRV